MPILQASALRKIFHLGQHTVNALDGVDFVVEKGEFVALMGPLGQRQIHAAAPDRRAG
jgi:putative ABC transport system ATP-binding protein